MFVHLDEVVDAVGLRLPGVLLERVEDDAGVARARAHRAQLLHRARAFRLPVQDVVLLKDDVTVETDIVSRSLEEKSGQWFGNFDQIHSTS